MTKRNAENRSHRFSAKGDFIERLEGRERIALIPREVIIPRMRLKRSETLVDLGSGIGYFSLPMAKRVKLVISVDIEPKMHEVLSSRIRAGAVKNIEPLRAEITNLPIADASVDHVLVAFVYHEIKDRKRLMAEASRVLKNRGILTVVDFEKRETSIGPPVEERKTPAQVIRSAPMNLRIVSRYSSEVFYQLEFEKT